MFSTFKKIVAYRELLLILAWKDISVRYKQAYFGIAWAVLKPTMLMAIFTVVRSFVGIDSGTVPYPVLTFAALMPWVLFQEATSAGVLSVTSNAALVRKIYFPREVLPLAAVVTKLFELAVNCIMLIALMLYYDIGVSAHIFWAPVYIGVTLVFGLGIALFGAALNVHYRDVASFLPVCISLLMYCSPIIYPLSLVQKTLLENNAAGEFSALLYKLYCMNPLVGIISSFQSVVLRSEAPDLAATMPGVAVAFLTFFLGYMYFKRAEKLFADVI